MILKVLLITLFNIKIMGKLYSILTNKDLLWIYRLEKVAAILLDIFAIYLIWNYVY